MDNKPDIDKLLDILEQGIEELLSSKDLGISELQAIPRLKDECKYLGDLFLTDLTRLTVFNKCYPRAAIDMPPLNTFFEVLKSAQRLDRCVPSEMRLSIKLSMLRFLYAVRFIAGCREGDGEWARYRQAFQEKCDYELPEGSVFRKIFHDNAYSMELERRLMSEIKDEIDKSMKPWERCYYEVVHYMGNNKSVNITSSEGITTLIGAINNVYRVVKDQEAPQEAKAALIWPLRMRIWPFMDAGDPCFVNELFNRRDEIPKDSILRNYIIFYYVQNEAVDKFKTNEIKGFKECFDELCRQHGEEEMLAWDMQKEDRRWKETLPEPMKKALAREEAERDREHEWVLEVLRKHEELRVSKGITDDEATALLTEEERAILYKRGYATKP